MTNIIRSIRSTLNLFIAVVELFVSTLLAIKIFSLDIGTEDGLAGYLMYFFEKIDSGANWIIKSDEITNSVSFLVVVLFFMIFCQILLIEVPKIIKQEKRGGPGPRGYQYSYYRKKRFAKNRFFKRYKKYY